MANDPAIKSFPLPPDKSTPPASSSGCGTGCLILIGCVIVGGILIGVVASLIGGNRSDSSSNDNQYEAIAQCEARIERLLKAPSTAEFDSSATASGGVWTVTGTVDSENSFGAMLRSNFQCTVEIHTDTATTTVDYLE